MIQFDHIIHYVNNLDEAREEGPLAIHSGGVHKRLGTENLLSYIDTRYIEYLTIRDREVFHDHLREAEDSFAKAIHKFNYTEGFIRYALATDDIVQLCERYRAQGFKTFGPLYMERETNGETLRWSLLYILSDTHMFPFFIQWEEDEDARRERIRSFGASMEPAEMKITQTVKDEAEWQAFFDVIGIWKGQVDENTVIELEEGDHPDMSIEIGTAGESGEYLGADYKFI